MKHLAAYILLVAGGNASPTAEDVTKLLATTGIDVDSEKLALLISELEVCTIQRSLHMMLFMTN